VRAEFPFAQRGRTSVVSEPTRSRWWTWAGQRTNATLSDALGDLAVTRGDDLSIGLEPVPDAMQAIRARLASLRPDALPTPSVAVEFAENMKFSDCLPPALALEVARQRLVDPAGVQRVLDELGTG